MIALRGSRSARMSSRASSITCASASSIVLASSASRARRRITVATNAASMISAIMPVAISGAQRNSSWCVGATCAPTLPAPFEWFASGMNPKRSWSRRNCAWKINPRVAKSSR